MKHNSLLVENILCNFHYRMMIRLQGKEVKMMYENTYSFMPKYEKYDFEKLNKRIEHHRKKISHYLNLGAKIHPK